MLVETLYLSSPVSADTLGITLLAEACEKLKGGASVTVDDLWLGELQDVSSLCHDKVLFTNSQAQLGKLKSANRAISRLQSSLTAKMKLLERAVLPASRFHGLGGLPENIIMRILNLCYESCGSDGKQERDLIRRLALTNRYFRDLVYGMPTLWTDICDRYNGWTSKSTLNALSRFSRLPLDVTLDRVGDHHAVKFISQWRKVTERRTRCMEPSSLSIPHLEELILHEPSYGPTPPSLLKDCHLPSLRTLWTDGNLMIPATIMRQLTSLSLTMVDLRSAEQIHDLCGLLRLGRGLRQLELGCVFADEGAFAGLIWPPARVLLPSLTTFSYGITLPESSGMDQERNSQFFHAVASITHMIAMPNIRSLRLKCNIVSSLRKLYVEDMFPSRIPSVPFIPKLQDVRFSLIASSSIGEDIVYDFLPRLLRHLPQPQHIELSGLTFVSHRTPRSFFAKCGLWRRAPGFLHDLASLLAPIKRISIKDSEASQAEAILLAMFEEEVVHVQEINIDVSAVHESGNANPYNSAFWTQRMNNWLEGNLFVEFM